MAQRSLTAAIGSLLGAIGTTGDAIGKTIDTMTVGIDIASYNADAWRAEAKAQSVNRIKSAPKIGKERAAVVLARHRGEILSLCKDTEFAALYTQALKELSEEEPSEEE